jgi:hypothetical protein
MVLACHYVECHSAGYCLIDCLSAKDSSNKYNFVKCHSTPEWHSSKWHFAGCHTFQCHSAGCNYAGHSHECLSDKGYSKIIAKCHSTSEWHFVECHFVQCHSAGYCHESLSGKGYSNSCNFAKCHSASEWHCAWCHSLECHSLQCPSPEFHISVGSILLNDILPTVIRPIVVSRPFK